MELDRAETCRRDVAMLMVTRATMLAGIVGELETISQDVGGDEHDGRDQEEDAGDEAGEGERIRQGRAARTEAQRTEIRLREGLYEPKFTVGSGSIVRRFNKNPAQP